MIKMGAVGVGGVVVHVAEPGFVVTLAAVGADGVVIAESDNLFGN